jgi:hypothetical protein
MRYQLLVLVLGAVFLSSVVTAQPPDDGWRATSTVQHYDVVSNTWPTTAPRPAARYGLDAVSVGGRLSLVSGRTNAGGWRMAPQVDYVQACPACRDLGWLDGYVYDYDAASATCTDARIHLEPGGANLSVAASGYYTTGLAPFDYLATASADGYPEPGGPFTVTVSAGATSRQDFALARPDITVDPLALSATAAASGTASRYLTITNSGPYTLHFEILEAVPDSARAIMAPLAPSQHGAKSQPPARESEIDVEPLLLRELDADGSTGYLIYFRDRPDLSAAFALDWIDRGRFVVNALQEAANRSQERVRAYLDEQGVEYSAYWIDNVILVQSSTRAVFDHLLDFPEIEALLSRRHPIFYEPVEQAAAGRGSTAVEPNLSHVGADRVWSELGITGEGIVVANIDTGVRFTHEALVSRYRGNLGTGGFEHNHPLLGGSDPVPNDWHGHGSHTMGIILGEDGGGNQIGMAPGATWIACQAFEMSDSELLDCGQFMAAPWDLAGANPDADLRPHIINNSWGDCLRYADHWYDGVIDSWHALGIYPVFSNGNASNCGYSTPPGCNTVGNPARAGNVTSVGSTGRDNGLYGPHSNWGPTDDPDTVNPGEYPNLKPQVLAPGVSIRSAHNTADTAYAFSSGTSMSAPHVTGLIALMWSAAPCLVGDYAATESILQETAALIPYASNCGGEGPADLPNMAAGWGEIDAYAAVDAAIAFCRADRLPWVKTDILSGTLGAAQEQPVQVTFTCTLTATQEPQPMEGILRVLHNDPCRDPVHVELGFYCSGPNPDPWWEKRLWINGVLAKSVEGPHTVQPGATVVIVDWVGASFAGPVTSTLTEAWDDSLALVSYDTAGVGTVTAGDHELTWNLVGVTPNTLYPITKTFEVQYSDWTDGTLHETYNVQHAIQQLPEVIVALERSEPDLELVKRGPATARDGEIVMLTLTVLSQDRPWTQVELIDPLPPGMTYAGNLTYSHGIAWEETNTIHWTNSIGAAPPPRARLSIHVGVLSPDGDPLQDLVDLLDGIDGIAAQRITGDLSTLHIDDLTPYQVIVTTNNNKWSDAGGNPNIGNLLADYVDAGGKIILADFAWDDPTNGWQLEGRLLDAGYTPYRLSGSDLGSASLGDYDPAHPVMQGVSDLSAIGNTAHQALALEAGATWIADWDDGQPCIYAQGDNVLGYNFLLDWSGIGWPWSGEVPTLLGNSVRWLMSHVTPLPPQVSISFDVQVAGEPGQVLRNTARLNWALGRTGGVHDILVSDVSDVYLPVIHRGY